MGDLGELRLQLVRAALDWAEADAAVRAETKSFRGLIEVCEFYEPAEPQDNATGYPGYDGTDTCWGRREEGGYGIVVCGPCAAHGDRRDVRNAAMRRREGAKRRMRRLAAIIKAACAEVL